MAKLNDTQAILLSGASQRDSGSVYPLPSTLTPGVRVTRGLADLLKSALVEEHEVSDTASAHHSDDDLSFGLFITDAGRRAIGIDDGVAGEAETQPSSPVVSERRTKAAAVLELLTREQGATLGDLIAATGWLPHTTRAALTGLRKKGHAIERIKVDGVTTYRVQAA